MIQRIQSIYLFLAAAALGLQFVLPYAIAPANSPATSTAVFADGAFNLLDNIGLLGLSILGLVLSAVAIFLFKNRSLQARTAGLGAIVSFLLIALAIFAFYQANQGLPAGAVVSYHLGLGMPLLAGMMQWLAQRAIGKDEALVKSMDRLR